MSGAERTRLYRQRRQAAQRDGPVTKPKAAAAEPRRATEPTEVAALKAEVARLKAEIEAPRAAPGIDLTLPKSAQAKLDVARRRLEGEFEWRVEQRAQETSAERLDQMGLPHWRKRVHEADEVLKVRKSILPLKLFHALLHAVHPDRHDPKHEEHYRLMRWATEELLKRKLVLVGEKEMPTERRATDMPRTVAEWEARRARATAERKRKYAASRARKAADPAKC